MNPSYPIYIVSKGRWEKKKRLTSLALEEIKVPYYIVVEESQYDNYASVIDPNKILILPQKYLDEYDTCDDMGSTKSKGPGAARNFCWEHSIELGAPYHWVMDDNIGSFRRLNRNMQIKVLSGTIFKCAEDFVERYENVAISGFNYDFFLPSKYKFPAFTVNTRIYSCLLIRNDIPYRWRGRYNEDTDLSLRVLKDGWCTIQFNAFIQEKKETQGLEGGNTDEFYKHEGTFNKSEMLVRLHPDVSKLTVRYGRDHHFVDYSPFKNNKLIAKKIDIPDIVNNYGMKMIEI